MKLYIDKECKLCKSFGEKIKNYEPRLEIHNYQKEEEPGCHPESRMEQTLILDYVHRKSEPLLLGNKW